MLCSCFNSQILPVVLWTLKINSNKYIVLKDGYYIIFSTTTYFCVTQTQILARYWALLAYFFLGQTENVHSLFCTW